MADSPMLIPEIEALKELARKWRSEPVGTMAPGWQRDRVEGHRDCADELESLIPRVEKAFAALRDVKLRSCNCKNCASFASQLEAALQREQ